MGGMKGEFGIENLLLCSVIGTPATEGVGRETVRPTDRLASKGTVSVNYSMKSGAAYQASFLCETSIVLVVEMGRSSLATWGHGV